MKRALAVGLALAALQVVVVACVIDADSKVLPGKACPCVDGYTCDAVTNRCVATTCPAGLTLCEGACFDLQRDPSHCGACGHACIIPDAVATCSGGSCVIAACDPMLGDCQQTNAGCPDRVNEADACGACDSDCAALFPPVDGGRSACRIGTKIVGVCQCVDSAQCGENARCTDGGLCLCHQGAAHCAFGERCTDAGACTCGGGDACADGLVCCPDRACHDLLHDDENCGHCGARCVLGFHCGASPDEEPRCMCQSDDDCDAGAANPRCDQDSGICVCSGASCDQAGHRCVVGPDGGDTCQ